MIKKFNLTELLNWTVKQLACWQAIIEGYKYILYGGARGGGKSRFLRWAAVAWLYMIYKTLGLTHVRVGLFCETYTDLRDRQATKMRLEFPEWMGELKDTKEDGLCYFLCEALGSGIIALRNLDDPAKYQSAEFAAIFVDELTKIMKSTFDILRGSLRWPGIKNTLFLAATNPGSVGHAWVKQLWIDKDFPPEMQKIKHKFKFIQSLPKDNPYLDDGYWEDLNSQPEDIRKAWVDGDWNIFSGQAFPNWRDHKHIITPFEIPEDWIRWRGLDWGYADPFCCLWFAKSPHNGRTIIYREAYYREKTDEDQAKIIKDMTLPNERIVYTLADPSMWQRKNLGNIVTTTANEFARLGVYLSKADNNRLQGKRKFDRLLADMPDGKPGLMFFDTCVNCKRTIPSLARSERNPEDVDPRGEDHCLTGDTIISTSHGKKRLDEVFVGDYVLTRKGYKKVLNSWLTQRNVENYTARFSNGRTLTGTGNHPVYVIGKGYIPLRSLGYGDIIIQEENLSWKTNLLCSMELLFAGIRKAKDGQTEFISNPMVDIANKVSVISIVKFGKAFMEIFQKLITSITKMGIHSIMIFPTLNACQDTITYQNTQKNIFQQKNIWMKCENSLLSGQDHQRELLGIKYLGNYLGNTEQKRPWFVNTAGRVSNLHFQTRNIAVENALQHQDENQGKTILQNLAQFVEKNFGLANILAATLVPENAVRVCAVEKNSNLVNVYNLTVKDVNEYFANGILVHNCWAAVMYGLSNFVLSTPVKKPYNNPWLKVGTNG